MIQISALKTIPTFVQGWVRDITARWALEELGLAYEVKLVSSEDQASPDYRKLQPFGQVPMLVEGGIQLFETGAIVLYLAEKSPTLLPRDPSQRVRVTSWMFAAMNTLDPLVKELEQVEFIFPTEKWAKIRKPLLIPSVRKRLLQVSEALGDKTYICEQFSAADILMTMVLRIIGETEVFQEFSVLVRYIERCEARPAFKRAMADHMSTYA